MATPAPGQGSLTVWMDRRGMHRALSTPARNDLRVLWAAAREVAACKSGECERGVALHVVCEYNSTCPCLQQNAVRTAALLPPTCHYSPANPRPALACCPAETAALLANNAALLEQLEATQSALRELGVEHGAAVVAAEAGALCAEAELARARDAAGHMMSLADQIQGLFALCEVRCGGDAFVEGIWELLRSVQVDAHLPAPRCSCKCQSLVPSLCWRVQSEKNELVAELDAAREKLAASEAAAADTASLSSQQQVQLAAQLEEARQAVAAAQAAADAAQQRATAAAAELESIRSQLAAAQAQLAAEEAAAAEQQQQTPLGKLRLQLGGLHESLAQLHAEHCAGRLQASTPDLDQVRRLGSVASEQACMQLGLLVHCVVDGMAVLTQHLAPANLPSSLLLCSFWRPAAPSWRRWSSCWAVTPPHCAWRTSTCTAAWRRHAACWQKTAPLLWAAAVQQFPAA